MTADKQTFWDFEAAVVQELKEAGLSQNRSLALLGISTGTWHHRNSPRPPSTQPVPHKERRSALWLTAQEVEQIRQGLRAAFAVDSSSVHQAYFEALDAGDPVASLSSWYRVARTLEPERPVRRRTRKRSNAVPQWQATGPGQVWSWDITKLKGPYKSVLYDCYVALDVFSRLVVGWRVEHVESGEHATEMFTEAIAAQGGVVPQIVHSDGGTSMTSRVMTEFLAGLGIQASRNRPRVSNDNPYSESWFRTAKQAPSMPAWFEDLEHARAWMTRFVHWYNTCHRHKSLAGHTPSTVHDGTWVDVHQQRLATLQNLVQANPERYPRGVRLKTPYTHATLNTPNPHTRLKTA